MATEVEFRLRTTPQTPEGIVRLTVDGIEQDWSRERFVGRAGAACELTITPPADETGAVPARFELHWSLAPAAFTPLSHGVELVAREEGSNRPLEFAPAAEVSPQPPRDSAVETTEMKVPG